MRKLIPTEPGVVWGHNTAQGIGAHDRVLFLDRDGVINVDHGYVHAAEDTQWVDGIFELCRGARDLGYGIVVATNQAGLARGYYSEPEFRAYTEWQHAEFEARGVEILATYYCPHHPTAGSGPLTKLCTCRKPAPGMLLAAEQRLVIDLAASALIGDKLSDIQAGRAAGVGHLYLVGSTVNAPEDFPEQVPHLFEVLENLKSTR